MKYSSTIVKILNIFILLMLTTFGSLYAQNNTDSPYSRYGIGIVKQAKFNGNFGLGGAGVAWRPYSYKPLVNDSLARHNPNLLDRKTNYINPANPASFSNISLTSFEASIVSSFVSYTSSSAETNSNNSYFNHMAIAFPIKESWGAGFGIMPYSSVGYNYTSTKEIGDGQRANFDYSGSGGLNRAFLGSAVEITNSISIGANAYYLFGNISNEQRVVLENVGQAFNSMEVNEFSVGDFMFDVGLQYFQDIGENHRLTLGAVAGIGDQMEGKGTTILRSYFGSTGSETFVDTIQNIEDQEIIVEVPVDYGAGIAFEKKGEWILMFDYKLRQWNDREYTANISNSNAHIVHVGFEALAEYNGIGNYLKRLGYRAAINYNSSLLKVEGQDVSEYGISFGTSLPLRKTFSMIVLGMELGKRGTTENNLIEEKYINLHIGVTINDKWFIQNKYD